MMSIRRRRYVSIGTQHLFVRPLNKTATIVPLSNERQRSQKRPHLGGRLGLPEKVALEPAMLQAARKSTAFTVLSFMSILFLPVVLLPEQPSGGAY